MPTATYIKFNTAIENMLESGNLETETYVLKLATAINTSAGSITETTNGGGYTTGGVSVTKSTSSQTSGTYTLAMTQPTNPVWTGSSGGFTFQYLVLVGSVSGPIGAWDYGSSQTVAASETVSVTITTIFTAS